MPDYANEIFLRDNNDIVYIRTHEGTSGGGGVRLLYMTELLRNLILFGIIILINAQQFSALVNCLLPRNEHSND